MAFLKFEPSKECTVLRIGVACVVQERVERYRAFCGALELADLVEFALARVMGRHADCGAQEMEGAAIPAKCGQRRSVKWVSPADKTGGAP